MLILLFIAVLFLAYANGANDNFKGVSTLFGSRAASYRPALLWATLATFLGSLAALWISKGLVKAFSGNGLMPASVVADPAFLLAVSLGAALTVFLATVTGLPISTTHALIGALIGAGCMAAGAQLNLGKLGQLFFLPLVLSPLLALGITAAVYPVFRAVRERLGVTKQLCLCVGPKREPVVLQQGGMVVLQSTGTALTVGELTECVEEYRGVLFGVNVQQWLDALHYLSAGAVSFARGLNDTPKIVALLVAAKALGFSFSFGLAIVGVGMALGGLLNARKVATTMSERITAMNHGQGLTANIVTAFLVIVASRWGLPVSTTHVSCGSLFGLGVVTKQARWRTVRTILSAWFWTLPLAAFVAAVVMVLIRSGFFL